MNTFNKLEVGAFVEFKTVGSYSGPIWRVAGIKRYWEDSDSNEKEQWLRAKLQKDTSGSESIILEYNPAYPNEAYVVELFDSYTYTKQPMPLVQEINDITYWTLDSEAPDECNHLGFKALVSKGQEEGYIVHWEYEGTTSDGEFDPTKIFQVYLDEGWIEKFVGIQLNTSHIQIF